MNDSLSKEFTPADNYWNHDDDCAALKELNEFLERPNSVGLDGIKSNLKEFVILMNELLGYETGYSLHHLVHEEHSSMAVEGVLKGDKERRRKYEEFLRLLEALERMLEAEFMKAFDYVSDRIDNIRNVIEAKLDAVDETLALAETGALASAGVVERAIKKKSLLSRMMKRLDKHEEALGDAENTEEIFEVEADLQQDLDAYESGNLGAVASRGNKKKSGFALIAGLVAAHKKRKEKAAAAIVAAAVEEPLYTTPYDPYETYSTRTAVADDDKGEEEGGTGQSEALDPDIDVCCG